VKIHVATKFSGIAVEPASQNVVGLQNLALHVAISVFLLATLVAAVVEIFKSGLRTTFFRNVFLTWWSEKSHAEKDFHRWANPSHLTTAWQRLHKPNDIHKSDKDYASVKAPESDIADQPDLISLYADVKWQRPPGDVESQGLEACKLPRDLFMKKIENIGRSVVEQSSSRSYDFIALTDGAPHADQYLAIIADLIDSSRPDLLDSIRRQRNDDSSELDPAIVFAQNQAATTLERNLDDLQLRLMRLWPLSVRTFAIVVGLIMATFGGWWIAGLTANIGYWILIAIIGIGAGVFANFVHDLATLVARLGRP
jgi:hypothetical protein